VAGAVLYSSLVFAGALELGQRQAPARQLAQLLGSRRQPAFVEAKGEHREVRILPPGKADGGIEHLKNGLRSVDLCGRCNGEESFEGHH